MRLPEDVRSSLKEPFGELFESTQSGIDYLNETEFERLVSVGDVVTAELLRGGIEPDIAIIDCLAMRAPIDDETREVEGFFPSYVRVENPPGHITRELQEAIETATPPLKIIVEGEEDLATLPAVLSSPLGSIVVYGQPDQGMVVVKVTEGKKKEFKELLGLFKSE